MPRRRPLLVSLLVLLSFVSGAVMARYHLLPYGVMKSVWGWFGGDDETTEQPQGAWYPAPAGGSIPEDLASIPYLQGRDTAPEVVRVTKLVAERAHHGSNLVVSGHAAEASLLDMKGNELHSWRRDIEDVWPGPLGFKEYEVHKQFWRRAHVFPNGDLLAIFEGIGMLKLDRDSNLLWANKGRYHHDLFVAEDGRIFTLSRHLRESYERFPTTGAVLEDFVAVLSPGGEEIERLSILDAILDSDYGGMLALAARQGDILHTNTIELMDGRFAGRHPMFARGNALLSMPSLNTIAVLDMKAKKIVWALGGLWSFQHQPTVLDDGTIMVFDNRGENGESKVVAIDPLTQEITWAYRSSPEHKLYSDVIGSCQRLPNGNTLITESTTGRALEVTGDGDTVWEFFNPNRAGKDAELIACLYEVVRIEPGYFTSGFVEALPDEPDAPLDLGGLEGLIERPK